MAEINAHKAFDKARTTQLFSSPAASSMAARLEKNPAVARSVTERERSADTTLSPLEELIFTLAEPYLLIKDNVRHTRNALEFSIKLLEQYAGDRDVVAPAVILHDAGCSLSKETIARAQNARPDRFSLVRLHEEESSRIARDILHEIGYDGRLASEIIDIIDGHDTRISPLSLNDKIVKDADKLTRYSSSFRFILHESGMPRNHLVAFLESAIDEWFFLDLSREMARSELAIRRSEDC